MALRPVFDLDLLRTLVFVSEEASFTKAAARVGRTQSAVSLQIQKLEAMVGQSLVTRARGGGVELTAQGATLAARAEEILALNDEAFRVLGATETAVTVRLGSSTNYAPYYLPRTLERIRTEQPHIRAEIHDTMSLKV